MRKMLPIECRKWFLLSGDILWVNIARQEAMRKIALRVGPCVFMYVEHDVGGGELCAGSKL